MADPIMAVQASMQTDVSSMNSISQNIANVQTPGYKATFKAAHSAIVQGQQGAQPNLSPVGMVQKLDTQFAGVKQTDRNLDFVATGQHYFVIQTPQGVRYTKRGAFQLNPEGMLVTAQGDAVLGSNGAIQLAQGGDVFLKQGVLWQNDAELAQFKLVTLSDANQVAMDEQGYLVTSQPLVAFDASGRDVLQGMLEQSNVNATQEMVRLIELSRHFSLGQKVLTAYDQMLDVGINKLGR